MIKRKCGWTPGVVIRKAEIPRSYIVKQTNGKIIRRNLYHLKPSRNEFVEKNCSSTRWDELFKNVIEGSCETQTTEENKQGI